MKTLGDFVGEEKRSLDKFKKWWLRMNKKEPENFPLQFEDGDEGSWVEQYTFFADGGCDEQTQNG